MRNRKSNNNQSYELNTKMDDAVEVMMVDHHIASLLNVCTEPTHGHVFTESHKNSIVSLAFA